uniref:Uncharacterized protein n=1 Tax=Tetraselmis chuii TaxID=63592 RepID=A0A7S1SQA7_9CHLO|mmetsp:Transcript_22784/g.40571  ORF Transcript_22784/g.40571 Transcript_22784/m.40571 type:complete len:246 (+) Transcript_22784:351-1088(+)
MESDKCPLCNEIFFCEVDDSSPAKSQDCACGIDWNDLKRTQAALATAFDVFGKAPYTKQLRHDVDEALRVDTEASKANSHLDRLSAALASRGHLATAHVSPAVCVDTPGSQFQVGLKHSFITCTPPDGIEDQARRIVDPAFREQFVIASPSPRYDRILEALPETFVGTFETLKLIIDIVALEMTASFNFQMMPTPPWRRVRALYSKWFPVFHKAATAGHSSLPSQPPRARFVLSQADFDRAAEAA